MIENIHPLKSSLTQNGLPKSIVETSRQAFAAAEHILHNHIGKKTNNLRGGDLLEKIASRIKEEEDASVQSSRKLRSSVKLDYRQLLHAGAHPGACNSHTRLGLCHGVFRHILGHFFPAKMESPPRL